MEKHSSIGHSRSMDLSATFQTLSFVLPSMTENPTVTSMARHFRMTTLHSRRSCYLATVGKQDSICRLDPIAFFYEQYPGSSFSGKHLELTFESGRHDDEVRNFGG